jgi:hypothetical protein
LSTAPPGGAPVHVSWKPGSGKRGGKEEVKAGKTVSAAYEEIKGKNNRPRKQTAESSDILMLPEDKYQATKDAIDEAIAVHDKQVVLRHNKQKILALEV